MINVNIEDVELRIEMFGGFVIIYQGKRVTELVRRSSKIWKLIQYLIVHRYKTISQDELVEVFCNDEEISNPSSTIRTMVYRARSALTESGLPFAEDMIISGNGGYRWNNSIRCTVDTEEFETLLKKAGAATNRNEKLGIILQTSALYKGDFLPNSAGELWVMPLDRWYRSAFLNSVHEALDILVETGYNDEAEELCVKALRTDPFDEKILEHHLCVLLAQGKNKEAFDEYNKMETMFFDVLGVSFSDRLRDLYTQIQRPELAEGASLDSILNGWLDGADYPGAYYCDISVFKMIYQIEARSAARSGRTAYIVRFEVKHEAGAKDGGVMKHLGKVIPLSLRKGDLFTRAAHGQYLLMLHSLTYENCKMLVSRILNTLDSRYLSKIIGTTIKPVTPIEIK